MTGLGESIFKKGEAQGTLDTLINLVKKGLLELRDAADEAKMSETEFSRLLEDK